MKKKILSLITKMKVACTTFVKQITTFFVKQITAFVKQFATPSASLVTRFAIIACLLLTVCPDIMAEVDGAGNYAAGTTALGTVTEEIAKYVPVMVKLCYAIAGVVAIVGAISVYIAMNNEEQDVKKKIMMIVGACIFLIAAAQALPLFFGIK